MNKFTKLGIICFVLMAILLFVGIPIILIQIYGLVGNNTVGGQQVVRFFEVKVLIINTMLCLVAILPVVGVVLLIIGNKSKPKSIDKKNKQHKQKLV